MCYCDYGKKGRRGRRPRKKFVREAEINIGEDPKEFCDILYKEFLIFWEAEYDEDGGDEWEVEACAPGVPKKLRTWPQEDLKSFLEEMHKGTFDHPLLYLKIWINNTEEC